MFITILYLLHLQKFVIGHREATSNYDEQNRIYMHKLESQGNTNPRFNSSEALGDRTQQITPNHISRQYEDYTTNGNKMDKGTCILLLYGEQCLCKFARKTSCSILIEK